MKKTFSKISLLAALGIALTAPPAWAAVRLDASQPDLEARARTLPSDAVLELGGLALESGLTESTLDLRRFEAFTPDAQIVVHGAGGTDSYQPVPKNVYYRGQVAGRPSSKAVLTVLDSGGMRGLIADRGRFWVLGGGDKAGGPVAGLAVREIQASTEMAELVSEFECATGDLEPPAQVFGDEIDAQAEAAAAAARAAAPAPALFEGATPTYTARVAFETDFEYYQLFGNVGDAVDYAGDLIAFASTIYSDEIDTSLILDYVSLWTTAADPWTQTSTTCGLFEFGRWWNDNRSSISRTFTHFLSGRSLGGGIAWVGVLCSSGFNYNHAGACPGLSPQSDNYGGDYGFSAGITGSFNINLPTSVWDIVVTSHEIGHNFNSPHTHCYEGIGGNAAAVDSCYSGQCGQSGCYCGATSLPCATPGAGCGTIMSYCHLLGGGLANISLTFGQGHPWGVAPDRVPDRMSAHVVAQANAHPGCLTYRDDVIFADDFQSGLGTWTENDPNNRLATSGAAGIAPGSSTGLAATIDAGDQSNAFLVDESPANERRYRLRFWYDPNSMTMQDNKRHKIATLFGSSPSQRRLLTLVIRKDPGAAYAILAKSHEDSDAWAKTAWINLSDLPHMIEVEWLRATVAGRGDGMLRFWLDGVLQETVTGIDNAGWNAEFLRLGNVGGLDVGTSGVQYFDEVESHRQTYIGF
ncbi:MAG: hypothetical protein KDD11_05540 [Acidobacteria bacterium]|nr:hypothetical protein [Acidobacteriota bacterium]